MNSTARANESSADLFMEPLPFKVTKIVLYAMILIFGTIGNTMIILILCRSKQLKKVPGNLFILNLAVCDLLTPLVSIPLDLTLVESNGKWYLGPVLCKLLPPIATFIATVSPLTLAVISLDRYRTLLHPFKKRLDKKIVRTYIVLVHLCSGILVLPYLIALELSADGYCYEVWPYHGQLLSKIYTIVLFLGQYALPLIFMATMYISAARSLFESTQRARSMSLSSCKNSSTTEGRSRNGSGNDSLSMDGLIRPHQARSYDSLQRHFYKESLHNVQVTKMFIVIVLVFAVMTLPLEVLWIWSEFGDGKTSRIYPAIAVMCRLFTYANSCLNPIIFYRLSRDFHRGFSNFFRKWTPCCEDKSAVKGTQLGAISGYGTWDHNLMRTRSPSWLTPRESFQSAHSVSFVDQEKSSPEKKMENRLNVPGADFENHRKSFPVELFNRISINKLSEGTNPKDDIDDSLHRSVLKVASTCTEHVLNSNCSISIKVLLCAGDITMDLRNLESLTILPQTDC